MAHLLKSVQPSLSVYRDRKFEGTQEEYEDALKKSNCLYIGNLSFFTTEEQVWTLFSRVGEIKRIVMGLDQFQRTPCGFCFVIYYERKDAEDAVNYLNGTVLDERSIRVDFDWGYQEGRQYGRGKSGGQVRDEYRTSFDSGRGGYGKLVQAEIDALMQDGPAQEQADNHDHRSEVGMRRERDENVVSPTAVKPSKIAKTSFDSRPSSSVQNPKFRRDGHEDD